MSLALFIGNEVDVEFGILLVDGSVRGGLIGDGGEFFVRKIRVGFLRDMGCVPS